MQKIFVVDDERQIADGLSVALREAQFDVETFYEAGSALLRANNSPPDILISDVVMPGMDGVALAQTLQKLNPGCKVILMSGNPLWTRHHNSRGDELNGFTLLTKPFSLKTLLGMLEPERS